MDTWAVVHIFALINEAIAGKKKVTVITLNSTMLTLKILNFKYFFLDLPMTTSNSSNELYPEKK